MTTKEKAKKLVQVYFRIVSDSNPLEDILVSAKKCALICVDEMLGIYDDEGYDGEDSEMAYLEEVKKEINKL
tara:strand:- start:6029 stop:6244 length:216 start_codon:yes stop_codon:yes gene_type:complete